MKQALKDLKSHRSLEQEDLNYISTSLTRYERVKGELEIEIQQLQKKNLLLQQELSNKDEIIRKFENANRVLSNNYQGNSK